MLFSFLSFEALRQQLLLMEVVPWMAPLLGGVGWVGGWVGEWDGCVAASRFSLSPRSDDGMERAVSRCYLLLHPARPVNHGAAFSLCVCSWLGASRGGGSLWCGGGDEKN